MPERMTPERLKKIEEVVHEFYSCSYMQTESNIAWHKLWKETIAEIKASWDDIDSLTGEIESIKHQDNDER